MIKRICAIFISLLFLSFPVSADFAGELAAFPPAWQAALSALHQKYPAWIFRAVPTGLSWDAVVSAETGKKSLVEKTSSPLLRSHAEGNYDPSSGAYTYYDASTWVAASGATVDFFMNPANFLSETFIFQFEALSYDPVYHTADGVELILQGTFMHHAKIAYVTADGETVQTDKTYAAVIMEAAAQSRVSPYYLASKIRTEIGVSPSGSVSGTYPGHPGIYNFYNIGANDGANPIANGLNWASLGSSYGRPWDTPEKSIINGAIWIGELYIAKGQNTMYLERFNVGPDTGYSLYTHQYMTNVYGAAGQAYATYTGYKSAGTLADAKVFYIPTFLNMPAADTNVTFRGAATQTGQATTGVNVRSGPGVSYDVAGHLQEGQTFTILNGRRTDKPDRMNFVDNPYWYHIEYNGQRGYISAGFAKLLPAHTLKAGDRLALSPAADGGSGNLYWENMNRNAVSVDSSGNVTALRRGTATIRAFTSGGGMATVCIKVSGGFTDMEGHWAAPVVEEVVKLGLFTGVTDELFSPDTTMTRAMFFTALARLYTVAGGNAKKDVSVLPYLDIDENAWYASSVAWAYDGGILPFMPSTMFSPSAPMTRAEMVRAAYNLARYIAADTSVETNVAAAFPDYAALDYDTQIAAAWCFDRGVIRGMGNGTLGLNETATRAQVAQIMMNMHQAIL